MKDRKTFLTNLKEAELIKLLKTKLIPDLQDTSEFNRKDGYSPSTDVIFEFKCRGRHYDTLLMDKPKYEALMRSKRVRFVVSTPEGIWSWNLKKLKDLVWEQRELPGSTWYYRAYPNVLKTVTYLDIKDAKNLTDILLS